MRVNIFGFSGNKITQSDNSYVDKKFITLSTNLNTKVNRNGDIMTGDIDMSSNKITNLLNPINPQDAVALNYLTSNYSTSTATVPYLPLTGGSLTGGLNMNSNKITSSHVPLLEDDLVDQKYADTLINTNTP